jgi:ankyrin repeat protein
MVPPCFRFFIFSVVLLVINVGLTLLAPPPAPCARGVSAGGAAPRRLGYSARPAAPADADLFSAASRGDLARVASLLSRGARVSATNNMWQTALQMAAAAGHASTVRALLAAGANVNAADVFGATPLIAAAREGRLEAVTALLEANALVASPIVVADGSDALLRAVRRGHVEVARALLAHGADVDTRDKQGRTPVMYAVQDNGAAMVALLIKEGAHLNLVSPDKVTALKWARVYKRSEIEALLVSAGATAA